MDILIDTGMLLSSVPIDPGVGINDQCAVRATPFGATDS